MFWPCRGRCTFAAKQDEIIDKTQTRASRQDLEIQRRPRTFQKLNYQTIMEKKNLVKQLLYEIERYKKMGNGAMCQNLMQELNRLNKTTQFSAAL